MHIRFWALVIVLVGGAATLGYASGRWHGLKEAQMISHDFLQDFVRSTAVETYLQERGQQNWLSRLSTYGLVGPQSYLQVGRKWSGIMLLSLLGVAAGLAGLRFAVRPTDLNQKVKPPD